MRTLICLSLLLMVSASRADEPPVLPPPKFVEPAPPPPLFVLPYHRVSAYAVWDFYAPDRRGAFKPRIIDTPYGAYRAFDGKPYPWVTTNSLLVTPTVTGTPYRMPYASD